jgi:Undecaprenyl-phosphate galactose phosphotransferase WbaP
MANASVTESAASLELRRSRITSFVERCKPIWRLRVVVASLVLSDLLVASVVWVAAYQLQSVWGNGALSTVAVTSIAPIVMLWIGLRWMLGLYPGYGLDAPECFRRHTYSVFAALAILSVFAIGFQVGNQLSRSLLILAFPGLLLLPPFVGYLVKRELKRSGLWGRPVIILSYKETGEQFSQLLKDEWELGYDPVAIFDYNLRPAGHSLEEASNRDTLAAAANMAREQGVDTAIFALPHTRREHLAKMVSAVSNTFCHVLVVPNLAGVTNSAVIARDLAGTFAVEIKHNLLDPWAQRLKRGLDLFGAIMGGLVITPLLLAIVILIKLDSQGPAFYGHRRVGARDEHFLCWKFRTMHANAEHLLNKYLQDNPELRAEWELNHKLLEDPRVTRIGRFLRKTSLDELPQLWNVLRGEMSLTGPRPIVDAEIRKYKKDYELYRRIKPGISGFWQVSGRSDIDYAERVAMDSYYVRNWSVWLDLIILFRTIRAVLRGRGAY